MVAAVDVVRVGRVGRVDDTADLAEGFGGSLLFDPAIVGPPELEGPLRDGGLDNSGTAVVRGRGRGRVGRVLIVGGDKLGILAHQVLVNPRIDQLTHRELGNSRERRVVAQTRATTVVGVVVDVGVGVSGRGGGARRVKGLGWRFGEGVGWVLENDGHDVEFEDVLVVAVILGVVDEGRF